MMYSSGMMDGWMMFGGWGLSHWLMMVLFAALVLFPVGMILKRLGYSPYWSALLFVPIINIIGLWVVALSDGNARNAEASQ